MILLGGFIGGIMLWILVMAVIVLIVAAWPLILGVTFPYLCYHYWRKAKCDKVLQDPS